MITVTGILTDAGGNPLPNAIIELYSRRNAGESFIHVESKDKTDSEGRYSFTLKSGEYDVYAQINHRSDVESLGIAVITSELSGEATLEEIMTFSEPVLPESVIEVRSLTQEVRDKHADVDGWQQQVSSDKDTAITQAGIATTQGSIATTKANEAATSEANSIAAKLASEQARDLSQAAQAAGETARDLSQTAQAASELARNQSQTAETNAANSAITAANSEIQTGLDTVATAADRVQTGLDRTQTGVDRVQTGLDKVATAADRVQTNLDKIATAADRVQTGLDVTQTATDRVQTGNDAIATNADKIQTGLDAVATAADRVQTGLDATATNADRTQTGLDVIQTAADRVQTGLDAATATTQAATATTKAGEASVSAAASEASAQRVEAFEASQYAMTAAEWNANCEQNKRKYKGAGFVEWGKHYIGMAGRYTNINQGLWTDTAAPNLLVMGPTSNGIFEVGSTSNTAHPLVYAAGALHTISYVNCPNIDQSILKLPPAPDGTKTVNSDTGVVTQHASAAEAFGGLVQDGDFRSGTAILWPINGSAISRTVTDGSLTVEDLNGSGGGVYQDIPVTIGTPYTIEFHGVVASSSRASFNVYDAVGSFTNSVIAEAPVDALNTSYTYTITPTTSNLRIYFYAGAGIGDNIQVSSVSVMPATESVITTRQDFGYLESFDVVVGTGAGELDFVAPLGATQCGLSIWEGITLVDITTLGVGQGFSAFGEWDTTTVGKVMQWSTATAAQKAAFLADPRNNLRFDPVTQKLICRMYRIKVVEGFGDDWGDMYSTNNAGTLRYSSNAYVRAQGPLDTSIDFINDGSGQWFYGNDTSDTSTPDVPNTWALHKNVLSTGAYKNKVLCIPLFLRQTLNQGVFHPSLNPMGCNQVRDSIGNVINWYHALALPIINSTSDCFIYTNNPYGSGAIGGVSGRDSANVYQFYDAVYAGQIQDLRLDVNERPYAEILEESTRAEVAGTKRGKGKIPFTSIIDVGKGGVATGLASSGFILYTVDDSNAEKYSWLPKNAGVSNVVAEAHGGVVLDGVPYEIDGAMRHVTVGVSIYIRLKDRAAAATAPTVVDAVFGRYLTPEFDQLPWCDVAGKPSRIAEEFPNGIAAQWLPQLPIGAALDLSLNKKCIASPAKAVYKSAVGVGWSAVDAAIDTVKNTHTTYAHIDSVLLLQYETLSDPTEAASNGSVIEKGIVVTNCAHGLTRGARLHASLTGAIPTNNTSLVGPIYNSELALKTYAVKPESGLIHNSTALLPTHEAVTGETPANDSAAMKALTTLTEKDGLLYPQFHGQSLEWDLSLDEGTEFIDITSADTSVKVVGQYYHVTDGIFQGYWRALIGTSTALTDPRWSIRGDYLIFETGTSYFERWNGNGWGDDSTIPIVSNEGTKTDLNGNVQKTFCHIGKFPVGIA